MTDNRQKNLPDAHTAKPSLNGRKALITGGTTGLGRAIAVLLASEGVEVFICGRNKDHLADALARIAEVGTGSGLALDLAERGGVDRFFDAAKERLGDWDIAIINAGIGSGGLTDVSEEELRYAVATDFTAYVLSAYRAVKHLQDRGDIIFTGSYSTHKLGPGSTVYAGCKSGVEGFAEALRREVSQQGIKVGLLTPAKTGSDIFDIPPDEQADAINEESMMRAEDIAVAVHYMLTQPRRTVVQEMVLAQRNTDA